jgi:tRNA threonylcarbamoyladenosine biosynthesis protein TsaB
MVVLGFDTATPSTAVALRLADGTTVERRDDPPAGAHPGHATRLLAMTGELLAGAEVSWSAVDRIAVGVGPGTFTGLRVGVATARGLGQSLGTELIGVSSLRALAAGALGGNGAQDPPGAPARGVLAVLDARRGQAFVAAYDRASLPDGGPRELHPPRALSTAELATAFDDAGDGDRRWLAVGDGAVRFRDQLELLGAVVPADGSPLHLIRAAVTCELGAAGTPASRTEEIEPEYGRRPDAEIALGASSR